MKPEVFESILSWRARRESLNGSIGFVPTMGALHEGHLQLVDRARRENDHVVVSIFVNPAQFNNADDLKNYPRHVGRDIELLETRGVDSVFLPNVKEMYADDYRYKMTELKEGQNLCGAFRPGHFDGVLTVMLKFLNIVDANNCYMGEKDYQQYRLVKDMAEALFLDVNIIGCPTVREASGLAMSSRNERLSLAGREHAAIIYKVLTEAKDVATAKAQLEAANFEVEYLEEQWGRRLTAVWYEKVRLIDNVTI